MIRAKFVPAAAWLLLLCEVACHKETISLPVFREAASAVTEDLSSVWMTDTLHGVAVGGKPWENGCILSTDDGGRSWQTDTLLGRKMEDVMFDGSGQGYVCGQDFALYRPPGSRHWYDFRVNYHWNKSCYFPDNQHGVMAGGEGFQSGQISSFGPDGFWRLDTLREIPNALADVWFSDAATAHAVGIGWVIRSADAGHSWQRLDVTGDFFRSVHFPTPETGYICGSSGTLLKTTDGGRSWQIIRKGGSTGKRNQPFRALWFTDADNGYVVGDNGLFWSTENGGLEWAQVKEAPPDADFTGIFALGGRGWAVAEKGRAFYFER